MKRNGCGLCAPVSSPEWVLSFQDGDRSDVGTREALLALGNGYVATRGAATEVVADEVNYPGTYVAGFYNRLSSSVDGRVREDESLVNLPNWLTLTFRTPGGDWFANDQAEVIHEHLALELRPGLLRREVVVVDHAGRRTRVRQRRLVSMAAPHVLAAQTAITAENWSGPIEVLSALDGRVSNGNSAAFRGLANRHLTGVATGTHGGDTVWLSAETSGSKLRVVQAARTRLCRNGRDAQPHRRLVSEPGLVGQELQTGIRQGEELIVEKSVTIFTSRDKAIYEPLSAALDELAITAGFDDLLVAHAGAWERL